MGGFEAAVIIETNEDREAAVIAAKQAIIRQGLNPQSALMTVLQGKAARYLYCTAGMTQAQHDERIRQGEEDGSFP